jgi:hypothetical protein
MLIGEFVIVHRSDEIRATEISNIAEKVVLTIGR